MSYATLADLKIRLRDVTGGIYAQLTSRTGGTTADDTVGQAILDEAESELNRYLARYALPLPTGDAYLAAVLKTATLDVAEYRAWAQVNPRNEIPKRVAEAFERVLKWLQDIAAGKVALASGTALDVSTSSGSTDEDIGETRVYGADDGSDE